MANKEPIEMNFRLKLKPATLERIQKRAASETIVRKGKLDPRGRVTATMIINELVESAMAEK